jgi:hypothetical protein
VRLVILHYPRQLFCPSMIALHLPEIAFVIVKFAAVATSEQEELARVLRGRWSHRRYVQCRSLKSEHLLRRESASVHLT